MGIDGLETQITNVSAGYLSKLCVFLFLHVFTCFYMLLHVFTCFYRPVCAVPIYHRVMQTYKLLMAAGFIMKILWHVCLLQNVSKHEGKNKTCLSFLH